MIQLQVNGDALLQHRKHRLYLDYTMALTDGLVAYYKLDESSGNATDSVGGFNMTNTNTCTFSA